MGKEVLDKGDYTFEYGTFAGIECGFYRCKICKIPKQAFKCRAESLMQDHVKNHKVREELKKAKILLESAR